MKFYYLRMKIKELNLLSLYSIVLKKIFYCLMIAISRVIKLIFQQIKQIPKMIKIWKKRSRIGKFRNWKFSNLNNFVKL